MSEFETITPDTLHANGIFHTIKETKFKKLEDFSNAIDQLNEISFLPQASIFAEELGKKIKKKKKAKRVRLSLSLVFASCAIFVTLFFTLLLPKIRYKEAVELFDQGKYPEAHNIRRVWHDFWDFWGEDDVFLEWNASVYHQAVQLHNEGKYQEALITLNKGYPYFGMTYDYKILYDRLSERLLPLTIQMIENGNYQEAYDILKYFSYPYIDRHFLDDDNECGELCVIALAACEQDWDYMLHHGGFSHITIPEGVTQIDADEFARESALQSISLPSTLTTIGDYAFYECNNLTSITIPDSVTSIGANAFYGCYNLTSITIPDSVTSIGANAFYGCYNLTSITIPDSVTSIGVNAFDECYNLTSITIGNGLTSLDNIPFSRCNNLTNVVIGNSITSIKDDKFRDCDSLTNVIIGNSITSIGDYSFYGCNNLTSIVLGKSITHIGECAFANSNIKDIYYTGTEEEWNLITKNYQDFPSSVTIHYNYQDTIQ